MKVETQNINRQFLSLNFGDVMWKPPQQFVLQPVQKPLMARCINLPSPPLPKGDFAPFQEMYLTSGIIVAEMQHAATHVVGLMDCWDLAIIIP